jgi:aminoacylase
MDVVPVEASLWLCDPFAGHIAADGKIYGRGAQDMKSWTIQVIYMRVFEVEPCKPPCCQVIEAIGRLKQSGAGPFERDVHVLVNPDEEVGGNKGVRQFIEMDEFRQLNVGVAIDEGLANPRDAYTLFYGERTPWWIRITATGNVRENGGGGGAGVFVDCVCGVMCGVSGWAW